MATNKLTRLKHLNELASRTKVELNKLDAKIQEIVTVGGEPNVIEVIKLNGVAQTITDKTVDLVIAHPEYSIVKAADSGDFAAVYNLTKDGVNIGASINIPKDIVVKSGSVVGDEIVLVLNDKDNTEIKIPVGSLIEYVTSGSATGDMVFITVDETTHKVTATITDGTITLAKLADEVKTAFDAKGSAATAEQNAKSYADGLAGNYDAKGAAAQALTDAKSYADGLAGNYDAKGAAATAEQNAKTYAKEYADGLAGNYDAKGSAATAEQNAKSYADGLAGNYDAKGSAAQALTDAKSYVDAMIATDAEVTAALDEVFGDQQEA